MQDLLNFNDMILRIVVALLMMTLGMMFLKYEKAKKDQQEQNSLNPLDLIVRNYKNEQRGEALNKKANLIIKRVTEISANCNNASIKDIEQHLNVLQANQSKYAKGSLKYSSLEVEICAYTNILKKHYDGLEACFVK